MHGHNHERDATARGRDCARMIARPSASSHATRLAMETSHDVALRVGQETSHEGSKRESLPRITTIPALRVSYMWPRRNARVAEALAALAAIDFVEFTYTKTVHGTQVFVLSVYRKRQQSRIPTNRASRVGSIELVDSALRRAIEPDYQLEKTLQEVQALRYHSREYARQQQRGTKRAAPCEYCAAFHALTHSQYSHTTLTTLVWPSAARRKRVVEGFVNAMVALSVHGLANLPRSQHCQGFANIPVRIERFLRRPYQALDRRVRC